MNDPQDDPPEPFVPDSGLSELLESDLDIPEDHILDFKSRQCHSSEDLDQALQAYQAYQVPSSQESTLSPERIIHHHYTYHVAQASQAKHGSLVDRGANGGFAGSDVRILSRSSRKCTVTCIDSHELLDLDVVQYAALVETNHGIVNLIMNENAFYGKGHTMTMEVQDYQILDQHSDEQVWCPSQLLALIPHLCVCPFQPHSLCSSRWQNTLICLNWYNPRHFHHFTFHFLSTCVLCNTLCRLGEHLG